MNANDYPDAELLACGVAEALTLAWHTQNEGISSFFEAQPL